MRKHALISTLMGFAALMLSVSCSFAQYSTADETKDFINDRLSHSIVQKIDPDGTVTMSAPDQKIKFRLADVSFNYNGGNDDDRVRVFCNNCIAHYEHKQLTETTSRQSFLCESEKDANEVITAFRHLKKLFTANQKSGMASDKKLKVSDSTLGTRTVAEAIDFVNENLSYSMVLDIDDMGMMTINAPEDIYRVDLKKAEFGYNDLDGSSRVRIYGDFCVEIKEDHGGKKFISRQSFQAHGRVQAYKVISVLYYLKSTYCDLDQAKIAALKNIGGTGPGSYKNVNEAMDYINSRLSYSIILGIDKTGNITINSPDDIYRFNIHDVKMSKTDHRNFKSDWFRVRIPVDYSPGVLFECNDCIKQYEAPDSYDAIDEQVFQCGSLKEANEVLKALAYIKSLNK
jgi:hypothetical protein